MDIKNVLEEVGDVLEESYDWFLEMIGYCKEDVMKPSEQCLQVILFNPATVARLWVRTRVLVLDP